MCLFESVCLNGSILEVCGFRQEAAGRMCVCVRGC